MLTDIHREKITYLNQYRYADKEIDRKIRELENWKSKIYNVTSTISDMPKGKGRADTIASGIANINEIEETINSDIDVLVNLRKNIETQINKVKDLKQKEVLKCRYLDFKKFEEIAVELKIDIRWIYRLHEKALDNLTIESH